MRRGGKETENNYPVENSRLQETVTLGSETETGAVCLF